MYTLERELGGGGMSRVFVAEETTLGRKVVIKVLPSETAAQVSLERFKREIMLAARLQHPHIVPLLSAGESEGVPYFTMPLVEGESLRARLARHGELPVSDAMRILREIASALAYAHERGIVHRDIKPDNELLSGGSAMVTDFGVAKALSASSNAEHVDGGVTSLGVALGTPAYMAPEQATADPAIDHRADLYAFGVLAYELLTGQPPFAGRTPQNLLAAHVTEVPEPIAKRRASLPPALAALVMRCLEKRPADRVQTAAEIVHGLDVITTPSGGMPPTGALPAPSGDAPPAVSGRSVGRKIATASAGVLVLGGLAWFAVRPARLRTADAAVSLKTIAVLPFATGGDTASDYLSEGITDEVRSALETVQGLAVKPRSVANQFKGHADDASAVAARLGIGTLVSGTLRRAGTRVRITAELVRVADNTSPWSRKFEGEENNLIALQDSIAHQIATALQTRLVDVGRPSGSAVGTTNPAAYDLYLRGTSLFHKRGEQPLRRAIGLFEKAIAADPSYARAYAALGATLAVLPSWSDTPGDSVLPSALAAVDKAISLDGTLAEAFAARGEALSYLRRWDEAERALRRSIELDPHYATAHQWLAENLAAEGRFEESIAMYRRGTELDEWSAITWGNMGLAQATLGQANASRASLQRAIELDAEGYFWHNILAIELVLSGDAAGALREIALMPDSGRPAKEVTQRAFVYARAGRRADAEAIARRLEQTGGARAIDVNAVGFAYLGLGDFERALTNFISGADRHDYFYSDLGREVEPLRALPRYPELMRKLNLQDQPIAKMKARAK
ncbi:MAG TPA: protein kinase [Gemmatimonadaceae bacterium]|nr:protein kinase [Gemmatimonadaceae bacterium]